MSGYASQREVREVVDGTLRMEGRNPADYSIAGIMRDAFYDRGPGYGYGALDEQAWRDAVARHRKPGAVNDAVYYWPHPAVSITDLVDLARALIGPDNGRPNPQYARGLVELIADASGLHQDGADQVRDALGI